LWGEIKNCYTAAKEVTVLLFSETCFDAFNQWMVKERLPTNQQCELGEETVPQRRQAAKLAKLLVFKYGKE